MRLPEITYSSWRQVAVCAGLVWVALLLFAATTWGESAETNIARKFEFWGRTTVGADPKLDKSIKVFVYDDATVAAFNSANIDLKRWQKIFTGLDKRQPKRIFVDKLFDLPPESASELEVFRQTVSGLRTPVIAGAFVSESDIKQRPKLRPTNGQFSNGSFDRFSRAEGHAYGPHPEVLPAFAAVGHLVYRGRGTIQPFFKFGAELILPHWGLHGADTAKVDGNSLYLNNVEVPLNRQNQFIVNIADEALYYNSAYSMKALIKYAEAGKKLTIVNPGDTIVILPAMYTGHTDWTQTPHGIMPGGFVTLSVVNSVLSGQWLHPISGNWFFIALGCALGAFLGALFWGIRFWVQLIGLLLLFPTLGMICFISLDHVAPWLFPSVGLFLTAGTIFAIRTNQSRIESLLVGKELETAGLVQKAFFPHADSNVSGLKINGLYRPASQCSGDWWGHFPVSEHEGYVIIGDVMGHGVPAALVTAMTYSAVQSTFEDLRKGRLSSLTPKDLLYRLNQIIYASFQGDMTMTMVVGKYNTTTNQLTMSNAGHPFPILFNENTEAKPKSLRLAGDMLGTASKISISEKTFPLAGGDRVLFYTDGLVECRSHTGEFWTTKTLIRRAKDILNSDNTDLANQIIDLAEHRLDGTTQEDDYTVVVLQITTEAKKQSLNSAS